MDDSAGWFPVSASWGDAGLEVRFADIPAAQFLEAFCQQTIALHSGRRVTKLFRFEELIEWKRARSPKSLAGLIFHTSKCGTTLQVRLLRCVPGLTVYPEPPVVNDLLFPGHGQSDERIVLALRLVADLLGQHAHGPFVVKLRSWNGLFASTVREAFADAPWTFSIRDPLEVGVSALSQRPTWIRAYVEQPNPFLPFAARLACTETLEDYFAAMYAAFCESISASTQGGILIPYPTLPDAIERVCQHFSISMSPQVKAEMLMTAKFESKDGFVDRVPFIADSIPKQNMASVALKRAVDDIARPWLVTVDSRFHAEKLSLV